ncbi:MAG: cytochrome c [Nitrospira sp.]|nr:cytochrome c [Nitrospira sp.]
MLFFKQLRAPVFMTMLGMLLVGCVAHHADEPDRQEQERASKHDPATPTIEATNDDEDQRSIQQGKALFHGKAACSECHGEDGNINRVSHSQLARLNPPPTDLRTPNDKSPRQLYLIIKYGISATGMIPIQEAAELNDEEILHVISYLSHLQGHSPSFDLISSQSFLPHTDTDVAISLICEQEALADVDKEERCEDRYAKRYRDLIIGRPPDISIDRYAEIEAGCKRQAVKDLDTLALCYRTEYLASRPATHKVGNDQ